MGVLEHLGELLVRDQELPMRLEAQDYLLRTEENGDQTLVFSVSSMNVQKKLDGTSFSNWMHYPFTEECLTGTVTLTLCKDRPILQLRHELESRQNMYVKYLRGPWLKIGEGAFGGTKDDAILPGVEWLSGAEWSSGSDWFREPWYHKYAAGSEQGCHSLHDAFEGRNGDRTGLESCKMGDALVQLPKAFRTAGLCGAEFRRQNG